MELTNCGNCEKYIPTKIRKISCTKCKLFYHVKCCNVNHRSYENLKNSGEDWNCLNCIKKGNTNLADSKTKCGQCKRTIAKNKTIISCTKCNKYYHAKCSSLTFNQYYKTTSWTCSSCIECILPFSKLEDEALLLTMQAKDLPFGDHVNLTPSFTIKSLIEKIPGTFNDSTEDYLSDSVSSKYYTPSDFISSKFTTASFSIFHMNIASLSAHVDDLKWLLDTLDHKFDIIGISETKIRESIEPLSDIKVPGYEFIQTPTKTSFGGVGLFIKEGLNYKIRHDLSNSICEVTESLFIELTDKSGNNLLVGCIYRHPSSAINTFIENFLEELLTNISKEKNKKCTILGDFNADLLKIGDHSETCDFYDILSSFGYKPLIMQPTRVTSKTATLIDNIFVNDIETRSSGGNITTSISDHFSQFCLMDIFDKPKPNKAPRYGRSYKNFNEEIFHNEIKQKDWNKLFENKSSESCMNTFYNTIEQLLDEMAPVKRLTKKEVNLLKRPWITKGILISIKNRDKIHKEYLKCKETNRKDQIYKIYKRKRNLITTLLRQSKGDYYQSFFEEHKSNVKKTWEGIRNIINISKKDRVIPTHVIYKNKLSDTKEEMAESFNDFFINIGNMVEEKIPKGKAKFSDYLKERNLKKMFLDPVDEMEIASMISQLKPSKICGPNSIPTKILKNNANVLTEPLKHLLNLSFAEGHFPNLLKMAEVCPIFKKKDKSKCENYRPISLLSNLSKLFERAMHTRMYEFLEKYDAFYELQFGFRKKYSTNHALLSIVEGIRQSLDNKTFSCGVFIDLEKAFDTVNHEILLNKLDHYGLRGLSNKWFQSYLSGRMQKVSLGGVCSEFKNITCGVPQGSILGPLLFLIYINDMHNAVKHSIVHHFADDTNLLCSDKNPNILRKKMNEDLKFIFEWLCANRLSLNVTKTEFIIFKPPRKRLDERITLKLNGTTLFESKKIKYLGIIMDDRLTWKHHIFELRKKINKSVGMIFKMKKMCPQRVQMSLYYSLIYSHLSYGVCVWGNADDIYIEKIRTIQNKAVRLISGCGRYDPVEPMYKKLNILKLDEIFLSEYAALMYDQDHGTLPSCFSNYFKQVNDIHSYETRMAFSNKLSENVKINTITYGKCMFKFKGPKVLNDLKELSFYRESKTKKYFRRKYKTYLIQEQK